MSETLISNELEVLEALLSLDGLRLVELGCGAAQLARQLLERHLTTEVVGLEVDVRQLAKNHLAPDERLHFELAGAQDIPFPDGTFDGALMLKSLHHVPLALMDQALTEVERVLRPGGWLYVSEPVYEGELNELVRLYNDEGVVRAAAQAALDRALASGRWVAGAERRFASPAHFASFDEFEQRMMRPTYADHGVDAAMVQRVRTCYQPHQGPDGAYFTRPMHVRLLRKRR